MNTFVNYNTNKRQTERAFRVVENTDPIINMYFSPANIKFIQMTVKNQIKNTMGININTAQDEQSLLIKMQEFYEMYRSNRHMLDGIRDYNKVVTSLNKQIIDHYISQIISGIKSYMHYHFMISNPPTDYIPIPENVSSKGNNVLGVNVGFLSSHERNQKVRQFNLNRYK